MKDVSTYIQRSSTIWPSIRRHSFSFTWPNGLVKAFVSTALRKMNCSCSEVTYPQKSSSWQIPTIRDQSRISWEKESFACHAENSGARSWQPVQECWTYTGATTVQCRIWMVITVPMSTPAALLPACVRAYRWMYIWIPRLTHGSLTRRSPRSMLTAADRLRILRDHESKATARAVILLLGQNAGLSCISWA